MKLLGRDFSADAVLAAVQARLAARGLSDLGQPSAPRGVEPRVDPLTFNLAALDEHADATRGLPIESHRDGLSGQLVVFAKRAFRRGGQVLINEALGRQRVFNGHVRDSYAQLSAELLRLKDRIAELEAELARERREKDAAPTRKRRSAR
jgi:hypothetical protein